MREHHALGRRLDGIGLLLWPILFLAAARLALLPMFEVTHALVDDWYNHAVSFAAFLLGFLVIKEGSVAAACQRLRWPALWLFAAAYAASAAPAFWVHGEEAGILTIPGRTHFIEATTDFRSWERMAFVADTAFTALPGTAEAFRFFRLPPAE